MARTFLTDNMIVVNVSGTNINQFSNHELEVAFVYFNGTNVAVTDDPVLSRAKPFWTAPAYEANYRSIYSCDNNAAITLLESALNNAFNRLGIHTSDRESVIETFAEHVLSK